MIISCLDQVIGAPACVIIQLHPAASYPRPGARNSDRHFQKSVFPCSHQPDGISPLIPMKTVICCKEKYKQEVKIRSIRAVFGLYLVPGNAKFLRFLGASLSGPHQGAALDLLTLAAPPDPPAGLGHDELFNQVPSYGF